MNRLRLILLSIIVFLTGCDSGSYHGPVSDHFDGKRFYNAGEYPKKSIFAFFTWWKAVKKNPWPQHVAAGTHPAVSAVTEPDQIKFTFINHSTVLLQSAKFNLLSDPIWSQRASPFSWIGPLRVRDPGLALSELPRIDAVIISHNHYDHMDVPTLKKLNDMFHPIFFVPLGNKKFLENEGLQKVVELDWWQQYQINNVEITFLPAQHWSGRWLLDRMLTLWGSYGIKIDHKKIYFAGDSGYAKHYQDIREKWGAPDVALLPIGAYEPAAMMWANHLNPAQAVEAYKDLNAAYSIGIHYGTFHLGAEGFEQPLTDLALARQQAQVSEKHFFTLTEGDAWVLR